MEVTAVATMMQSALAFRPGYDADYPRSLSVLLKRRNYSLTDGSSFCCFD